MKMSEALRARQDVSNILLDLLAMVLVLTFVCGL